MNLIKQAFDTEEHYKGVLKAGSIDKAKATIDVKYNRIDPKEINVKVYDIEWFNYPSRQPIPVEETKYLEFYSKEDNLLLKLDETDSITFSEANCSALEYRKGPDVSEFNGDNGGNLSETSCTYFFPLTGLTINTGGTTFHDEKGIIRGFSKSNRWEDTEYDWTNQIIELNTSNASMVIYDSMAHENFESMDYHYGIVIGRQTTMVLQKLNNSSHFSLDNARLFINVFFNMLSLIEQQSIDWHTERYRCEKSILTILPNRATSKRSPLVRRSFRYQKECLLLLQKLIDTYFSLTVVGKNDFDDIIYSYRIATGAKTVETMLIYYHSCLDLLKKKFGFPDKPFSSQLQKACIEANVQLDDLSFPMSKNKTGKFRFNEIRDSFLHDGFHIEDYQEVINETRKMRALTERMMLSLLDMDYRETKLGLPSF